MAWGVPTYSRNAVNRAMEALTMQIMQNLHGKGGMFGSGVMPVGGKEFKGNGASLKGRGANSLGGACRLTARTLHHLPTQTHTERFLAVLATAASPSFAQKLRLHTPIFSIGDDGSVQF